MPNSRQPKLFHAFMWPIADDDVRDWNGSNVIMKVGRVAPIDIATVDLGILFQKCFYKQKFGPFTV